MRRVVALIALLTSALVMLAGAPSAAAGDVECIGTLAPGTYDDNIVVPPNQTCILTGVTVIGNVKALEDSLLSLSLSTVRGNVLGAKADAVFVDGSIVRENIIVREGGPAPSPPPSGFTGCFVDLTCEVVVGGTTVEEGGIQIEKMQGSVVVTSTAVLNPIAGFLNPIGGNVQVKENVAAAGGGVFVGFNNVAQNMQVEDNFGVTVFAPPFFFRGLAVVFNRVRENLQVYKNEGSGSKLVSDNTVGESLQCFDNEAPFVGMPNVAREAQGQCSAAPLP